MPTRRSVVAGTLAAGVAMPFAARAQSWPTDVVRIIIPVAAGGPLDSIARLIQPELQRLLGATIVIENRPGASSTIGATMVAKSPPDGATWLFTADSFLVGVLLLDDKPYDAQRDFEPVTLVSNGPMVLCCNPSRPWRTLAELVADAQKRPDTITCGTTGRGGIGHLSRVGLSRRVGMRIVNVPYRGGGPAMNDAVAGHVDLIMSATSSVAQQIEAGKLRALVQCGAKRAAFIPDVPTASESLAPGYEASTWYAVFAPAGTPGALVQRMYEGLAAIIGERAMHDDIVRKFRMDLPLLKPAEFKALVARQIPEWMQLIRENNIKSTG
ncbi:MAG: hypothetical protein IT538_03040 [Variibacter sp.]|nr:hypothetical protein [Variibacter sp.]